MARIAGKVDFIADGKRYELGESVTISPFQSTKESVVGVNGPIGHKKTGVAPSIEVELGTTDATLLKMLEGLDGVTVSAKCANGLQYVLKDAFVEGQPEINPIDGKVTVKFVGTTMDEV